MAELKDGVLVDPKVMVRRFPAIEHGPLRCVCAIVVHQTDSTTATSTFNSYVKGPNGAHFLIDSQDRSIRQQASMPGVITWVR